MNASKMAPPICLLALMALAGLCGRIDAGNEAAQSAPAGPAGNIEYWLNRARFRAPQTASAPAQGVNPFGTKSAHPSHALPGAVQMSDGQTLAGWLYTTEDKPIKVFVEAQQRWRLVPLAAALSISAVVVESRQERSWRWKQMGIPERVYTGRGYPMRRLQWQISLADGSAIEGTVKGQPIYLLCQDQRPQTLILHERLRGREGQTLDDLTHVSKLVVSIRAMERLASSKTSTQPASAPAKWDRPPPLPKEPRIP